MSDTTEQAETTSEAEETGKKAKKAKGGKSNVVPAIILAVGLLGGGYFMGSGGSAEAGEHVTVVSEPKLGEIVTMEPININLAEGHFLRVGLALQLIEGIEAKEFQSSTAKANDILISKLGGRTMQELGSAEGRDLIKHELKELMKEAYEDEVVDVYFTDFVMQ